MKINPKIIGLFGKIFILILLNFLLNILNSCSSSETPSQNSLGPSKIMGTFFEVPVEYSAGENPVDIVLADFNVDNRTDILVTSPTKQVGTETVEDGSMVLFLEDSSNSSPFPFNSSILTPSDSEWRQDVISTDYNGDNISDLIVTNSETEIVKFLNNDGSANFSDNGSVNVGKTPINIITGDWNNDNNTDIAVVNRDNSSVSIINNISGTFSVSQTLSTEENPISLSSGDWNKDTYTDLAVLSKTSNFVEIFINNGGGFFSLLDTKYAVGSSPFEIISGDWNCDTNNDLAVTNSAESTLSLIYGNGSGSFDSPIKIVSGRGPRGIAAAEFNNDSIIDFVVGHQFLVGTPGLSLLTGDVSLTLSDNSTSSGYAEPISFAASMVENGSSPAELSIFDVDNDSRLDILITLPARKKLVLLSGKQFSGNLSCP